MGGLCRAILAEVPSRRLGPGRAVERGGRSRRDLEIDRLVEVDAAVLQVLALRAPVATDLRQVLAIKNLATDLERVGDLARNIARPPPTV
ncbi:MAG: PhoU domain-containing protein [Myxococcota bacterium]